ncbi:hypothetical protein IC582_009071 [Cucumis melo]
MSRIDSLQAADICWNRNNANEFSSIVKCKIFPKDLFATFLLL